MLSGGINSQKSNHMATKVRWVIAHEPIGLFLKVADRFAQEVNEKTNNAFDIEVLSLTDYSDKYNDGKKISKTDLLRLIDSGAIEMCHIYTTWLGDYNKDMHVLDLPFLFRDHDHADRVLDGEIGAELLEGIARASHIRPMSFTYSGGYRIVPANFKADTADAFKGRKVRTSRSPVAADTFKALGAEEFTNITLEEMNKAADDGVIEAGESTYVRVFPLKQNDSFKYVNDTAHSLFLTSIMANQGFFDTLDSATQKIVVDATRRAAKLERKESVEDIPNVLAQCQREGVEVVRMPESEFAKFKEITAQVYDKYADYFNDKDIIRKIQSA